MVANLRRHTKDLSEIRSAWNRSFSTQLDKQIDCALTEILKMDAVSVSRYVKFDMYQSIQLATRNLYLLKIQLEYDIRHDRERLDEYLKLFGFTKYQETLANITELEVIDLLSGFVANSPECIKREINRLGISRELLDKLMKSSVELNDMRKIQEELLFQNNDISDEGISRLNGIYEELVAICTISRVYFVGMPKKQRLFNLPEIVSRLEGICPDSPR